MTDIFKAKDTMPGAVTPPDYGIVLAGPAQERPFAVGTMQTVEQQRSVLRSNWPRHDWGDVQNLRPVRRGHGY